MTATLQQIRDIFCRHKDRALCVDIETTRFNGEIAILGAYRPAEGIIQTTQLVRGTNLTPDNVATLFRGCRLILTYNGTAHDLPKLRREFPTVIAPGTHHLDLFELAQRLGLKTSLRVLEVQFGIFREEPYLNWRRKALKLWKSYSETGSQRALHSLLRYNANDCVNLYPLAEELMRRLQRRSEAIERAIAAPDGREREPS